MNSIPTVTDFILANSSLQIQTEHGTSPEQGWRMFNSGGVEADIGEFLFGLVRMCKPTHILETGTHLGISSSYFALALAENQLPGTLITLEFDEGNHQKAKQLWQTLGITDRIDGRAMRSMEHKPPVDFYDMILLDTEPNIRFDEFVHFMPSLKPGGILLIHDLHEHLGHDDRVTNGMYDWPYGDFRPKLGPAIKSHQVSVMSFKTPRGLTMFQKMSPEHGSFNLLTGKW